MYNPEFCMKFTPYLDPKTWENESGRLVPWKDRVLIKDAPQSAIDAFEEYKRLEAESEKNGIYR